jgi:hypothetical protein
MEAEIKTCLLEVEAMDLKANPEYKETVAEQQEVPKEEAAVKTVRAQKKRYGDRHVVVGCADSCKNEPRVMMGPGRNWPPSAEGVSRHAIPAWRKGHCHHGQGKDKAVQRT